MGRSRTTLASTGARSPRLDGVRGLAIGLVVVGHTVIGLTGASAVGVDLFFVLSGYLITRSLLNEAQGSSSIALGRFYAKRVLRLLPALAVMLSVYLLWASVTYSGPSLGHEVHMSAVAFFYLMNWSQMLVHHGSWALSHTWSLAMEEQFYLTWPPLLVLALRRGRAVRSSTLGWAIAISALVRLSLFALGGPLHLGITYYYSPFTWVDALLLGCWLASTDGASRAYRALASPRAVVPATVILGVVCLAPLPDLLYPAGFTALALACAVIVIAGLNPPQGRRDILASKPLTHLGRISYALYLWQVPMQWWAWHITGSSPTTAATALIATPAAFVAAHCSYWFVERPALTLKARLTQPRSHAVPLVPAPVAPEPA